MNAILTAEEQVQEVLKIRSTLNQANKAYYVDGHPTMSDAEYDALMAKLVSLEKQQGLFNPNSPTARVGSDLSSTFSKVKHDRPMLSLDNKFTADEVRTFFGGLGLPNDTVVVCEPKIDGLSLSITYKDGELVMAKTRGDGGVGDDVTANVRTIRSVPLTLTTKINMEVRGEVYMGVKDFLALNEIRQKEGDELFSNARNAASGSLKQKDSRETAKRKLSFIAYQTFGTRTLNSQEQTNLLLSLGFVNVAIGTRGTVASIDSMLAQMQEMRSSYEFETDGLVFKIDNFKLREEAGLGTKSPKWACAFKFPPENKPTLLEDIVVQVGRQGTITPVAHLKTVILGGAKVNRASLCNEDEIARLGINIGDEVLVCRAAEVIPKVVGLQRKGRNEGAWTMPKICPSCNTQLVRNGVHYFCTNKACPAQVYEQLLHACSKQALDIDGCGEAAVEMLIEHGVTTIAGLFTIADVSFLGDVASKKFLASRKAALNQPLWRKLRALGIEGLGSTNAKELASRWPSMEQIIEHRAEWPTLIGAFNSFSFERWLCDHVQDVLDMYAAGFKLEEEAKKVGPLTGRVYVITGAMMSGSRDEVSQRIEAMGGLVKNSVSKKCHFLVLGPGAGANKSRDAARHNVPVISEEQLFEQMGIPMPVASSTDTDELDL